jgi:hypothetical protein
MRKAKADPSSELAREPLAVRLVLSLALVLGLANILAPSVVGAWQIALYAVICLVNLLPWHSSWVVRLGRWFVLLGFAPVFLRLTEDPAPEHATETLRQIHYALLGCALLAPFSPCRSKKDLAGFSALVLCLFFFSAAFLRADYFAPLLTVATLSILFAYYHYRPEQTPEHAPGCRRDASLATAHLLVALGVLAIVFVVFPRSLFSNTLTPLEFLVRSGVQSAANYSRSLTELGIDPRRDLLKLTNLHELSRTSAEVLQVRLLDETTRNPYLPDRPLYLRANLYETYQNGAWVSNLKPLVLADGDDGRANQWVQVAPPSGKPDRPVVRQLIRMKPLADLCFCLPDPLRINLPKVKSFEQAYLMFPYLNHMDRDYTVVSELLPRPDYAPLKIAPAFDITPALEPYCQVPKYLIRPLRNWRSGLADIPLPWARAEQIRRLLETEYAYSLGAFMPEEDYDPVEYFLFSKKSGYCTHYASAMALLARIHGLPARVATGFCVSGPPTPGGHYEVFDHHAHAWTEIYFPDHGWIIFDATPAMYHPPFAGQVEVGGLGFALMMLVRLNDFLSEFDATAQVEFLKWLLFLPVELLIQVAVSLRSPWLWVGLIVALVGLRQTLPRISPARRRHIRRLFTRKRFAPSVPFFDDFLWILARAGIHKPDAMTGREFARALGNRCPATAVSWLTDQYYAVQYGGKRLSEVDLACAERHLEQLEQDVKLNP